jgi:hypothetical protein
MALEDAEKNSNSTTRWNSSRIDELLNSHPVAKGRYMIPTPMVKFAHEEARERVWSGRTGVVFYGDTRAGKTTCAKAVAESLKEEFNNIYITMASARRTLRPQEGHMARLILEGSGHILARRPDPNLLLRSLMLDIQTNVRSRNGDQYALILDEVNLLNEFDLTSLLEIHNSLDLKGIRMTTISFGQPEILTLIDALKVSEQQQIIARFFRKPIIFRNCDSESTLKQILEDLDLKSEWPEHSGWSFTYFFFPKAFERGFRMAQYAPALWRAMEDVMNGKSSSISMEIIALTVNALYLGYRAQDSADLQFSDEDIRKALDCADV